MFISVILSARLQDIQRI